MIQIVQDLEIEKLPMHIIEEIANEFHTKIQFGIDCDYCVYVYLDAFYGMTYKHLMRDITGRGQSYKDACIDYVNQLLDKNILLRHNDIYATSRARKIINKNKFTKYYNIE